MWGWRLLLDVSFEHCLVSLINAQWLGLKSTPGKDASDISARCQSIFCSMREATSSAPKNKKYSVGDCRAVWFDFYTWETNKTVWQWIWLTDKIIKPHRISELLGLESREQSLNILGWKGPISIIVAPQRTTQSSNPTSDSIVLTLLELQQLRAMPAALKSLFHAHHPLMKNLSLTPSCLTQLYAIPSGPVNCPALLVHLDLSSRPYHSQRSQQLL